MVLSAVELFCLRNEQVHGKHESTSNQGRKGRDGERERGEKHGVSYEHMHGLFKPRAHLTGQCVKEEREGERWSSVIAELRGSEKRLLI